MSVTRSLCASAIFLSFSALSDAWAVFSGGRDRRQDVEEPAAIEVRHKAVQAHNIQKRQENHLYCPDDRWQQILDSNPDARIKTFCNEWLGIQPATEVVETTPTMFVASHSRMQSI